MSKTELFDLDGKVALVSGASRGIGKAIAKLLAQQGAHVIATSRKVESCEAVCSAIRDAGGSAEALACHIGDPDAIQNAVDTVVGKHGKIDILGKQCCCQSLFRPYS